MPNATDAPDDSRWFVHPDGPDRIWFLFALRDELPLGDMWGVWVHEPRCGETNPPACQTGGPCWGKRVQFIPIPFTDTGYEKAMDDLSHVFEALTATPATEPFPALPGQDNRRWVAAVSLLAGTADAVDQAIDLTHDALAALRVATNSNLPGFSIERVWPMYFIADSDAAGKVELRNLIMVTHGRFGPLPAATTEQLDRATQFLFHRWRRSPIEIYTDFAHSARMSLWQEGDRTKAVMSAAVACEVLLKHAAWMVTYEASSAGTDPAPDATTTGLGALKPSQLIGQVLTKRLGGNWSSNDGTKPVGAWRHHVAQLRAQLLHRGHRPNEEEAVLAVDAMQLLETHVCDRLAHKGASYPRTAWALVGLAGLDRRSALGLVTKALDGTDFVPEDWLSSYVEHLDATLDVTFDD